MGLLITMLTEECLLWRRKRTCLLITALLTQLIGSPALATYLLTMTTGSLVLGTVTYRHRECTERPAVFSFVNTEDRYVSTLMSVLLPSRTQVSSVHDT